EVEESTIVNCWKKTEITPLLSDTEIDDSSLAAQDVIDLEEYEKDRVVRRIIDVCLQEIKLNVLHKVSHGSENSLVEIITRLIDTVMYHLPVGYEIEVTRTEQVNIPTQNVFWNPPIIGGAPCIKA
ncbi:3912_t:CDS:1, partial [Gigaspora rosea]